MRYEMSKGDARRVTIVEELLAGRTSIEQAARLLNLSVRQIMRLKAEAAANGPMAVLHKNRGRKPANALDPVLAETIVDICTSRLAGYNFCHMADVLAEDYGIFVSVSTLSRLLRKEGIRSQSQTQGQEALLQGGQAAGRGARADGRVPLRLAVGRFLPAPASARWTTRARLGAALRQGGDLRGLLPAHVPDE